MAKSLFRELIALTEDFEKDFSSGEQDIVNFTQWLSSKVGQNQPIPVQKWEGMENGRSAESIINTSLVHLFRYAKFYGKHAISGSKFSTIDDVIFLINLQHLGSMTKTGLIDHNIQEKSTGIQIINRLIAGGLVTELVDSRDRRSKLISITGKGRAALEEHMPRIREASIKVVGNLDENEKLHLIRLLQKLELFHQDALKQLK